MVIPRGWRSSEPSPVPKASGSAPKIAAQGRHHDRPKTQQARLLDRLVRVESLPLRLEREIDHHDRVLLHDADQQQHADRGDDRELDVEQPQRQRGADARRE